MLGMSASFYSINYCWNIVSFQSFAISFNDQKSTWNICSQWQNRHVIVFCDNQAAVAMINKGSTASPLMMTYLRLLFWLSASFNFRITAKYLPGKDNCVADCISRLHEPQMMLRWAQWLLHSSIQSPIMHLLHNMSYSTYCLLIQWFTSSHSFYFRSSGNSAGPRSDSISISSLC